MQTQMKTGMEKLSPEKLKAAGIDGVIFANTTGDLPLPDKEGFIQWIEDGHAFIGMHSASDTFHGFPGYLDMLQGEFAGHGAQVPADLVGTDTAHPANGGIGASWKLAQEEMYRIKHHERAKLRALWFLRHDPNDAAKEGYNTVSWCRMAGKGRVFLHLAGASRGSLERRYAAEGSQEFCRDQQAIPGAHPGRDGRWALGLAEGSAEPNPDAK